jgi:hypothetical protein
MLTHERDSWHGTRPERSRRAGEAVAPPIQVQRLLGSRRANRQSPAPTRQGAAGEQYATARAVLPRRRHRAQGVFVPGSEGQRRHPLSLTRSASAAVAGLPVARALPLQIREVRRSPSGRPPRHRIVGPLVRRRRAATSAARTPRYRSVAATHQGCVEPDRDDLLLLAGFHVRRATTVCRRRARCRRVHRHRAARVCSGETGGSIS